MTGEVPRLSEPPPPPPASTTTSEAEKWRELLVNIVRADRESDGRTRRMAVLNAIALAAAELQEAGELP